MSTEMVANTQFNMMFLENNEFREIVDEELDGQLSFSAFRRVKMPAGGGLSFEITTENANKPEVTQELTGIIIFHHSFRQYYKERVARPGKKPDCISYDCKTGVGDPGGNCNGCPKSVFVKGKGFDCPIKKRLFIIRSGEFLPVYLDIPPTSLNNFDNYVSKLISMRMIRPSQVITTITLARDTSRGGETISKAEFTMLDVIDQKRWPELKAYREALKVMTARASMQADEIDAIEEPVAEAEVTKVNEAKATVNSVVVPFNPLIADDLPY